MIRDQFETVIVGGGPAGLAVLLNANKAGSLRELLSRGLLLVERDDRIGSGQLSNYVINSDSTGLTFVDSLRAGDEPEIQRVLASPVAVRIASAGHGAVPLQDVAELMILIGEALTVVLSRYPESAVLTSTTVESAQRCPDGKWHLVLRRRGQPDQVVSARQVVLATGATQSREKLERDTVAGIPLVERWGSRLMQSGEVLRKGGLATVAERLGKLDKPRVVIVGGSTSAMAVAHSLLFRMPAETFGAAAVTLLHRRPIRIYYESVQEALNDGYSEFSFEDICPVTRRLFRFAGARLDSRELMLQAHGLGGRKPEPRLKLHPIQADEAEARQLLDQADLVVAALGYRPNGLRLLDEGGSEIPLLAESGPAAPLVDKRCRVLDRTGRPIARVYGIGLAAGFMPQGKLGGEPSFSGQVNGLWLWQNGVGAIIIGQILSNSRSIASPSSATPPHQASVPPSLGPRAVQGVA